MPGEPAQPGIVSRTMRKLSEKGAAQLSDAAQRALFTTRAAGAAIALLDGHEMFTCASCGESVPPAGARSPVSGFTGLTIEKREAQVCDDTQADSRVDAAVCKALNVRSMAVAPIKVNGVIEGVFAIFFNSPRAISRMHVAMLRTLADAAAVVLEREPEAEASRGTVPNDSVAAPSTEKAPAVFPVVPNPADLPAALHEITDDEIAEVVDQLHSEAEAVAPIQVAGRPAVDDASPVKSPPHTNAIVAAKAEPILPVMPSDTPAVAAHTSPASDAKPPAIVTPRPALPPAKRNAVEVLPPAADPMLKVPSVAAVPPLASKDVRGPRVQRSTPVSLNVTPQAPLFQAFAKDTLRRQRTRRMLLPVAGLAAVVIAVAGFMLYRSPGVKATSDTPQPTVSDAAPDVALSAPAPREETVIVEAPAPRPTPHATESAKRNEEASKPEPPAAEPAIVVRRSTRETRATIAEPEPVEAPALNVAPSASSVALLPPASAAPAAPSPQVEPAVLIQKTRVVYPQFARDRRIQGTVVLRVSISKEGKVVHATRIAGDSVLGMAAVDTVKTWRYQPARRDGVPVESDAQVSIVFHLGTGAQ